MTKIAKLTLARETLRTLANAPTRRAGAGAEGHESYFTTGCVSRIQNCFATEGNCFTN
jgi:hypothetical protein